MGQFNIETAEAEMQGTVAGESGGGGSGGGSSDYVPLTQSIVLGNGTYEDIFNWTVTGQTDDPLPEFGLTIGSQTYTNGTESTQGPAFWWGYNPRLLSAELASSSHGAIGSSCFADAGDTNVNGAHGLEYNPCCFRTADGTKATGAIEFVAVDDNTNTCSLGFRCGNGNTGSGANTVLSEINFSTAEGEVSFMYFFYQTAATTGGAPYGGCTIGVPALVQPPAGTQTHLLVSSQGSDNCNIEFKAAAANKIAGFQLNVNNTPGFTVNYNQSLGIAYFTGPGGQTYLYGYNAGWYSFSPATFDSGLTVVGYLSIPQTSGAPTSQPGGACSLAYDPAANKLWAYSASNGWKGVTLS